MIVIDCSILIAGTAHDESSALADRIFEKLESFEVNAIVPSIFFLEIANVLVSNLRRKRIDISDIEKYTELFAGLPIRRDENGRIEDIINIAVEYGLSAYDAAYLELAKRNNFPLVTLDKKLGEAAEKSGVGYDG